MHELVFLPQADAPVALDLWHSYLSTGKGCMLSHAVLQLGSGSMEWLYPNFMLICRWNWIHGIPIAQAAQ